MVKEQLYLNVKNAIDNSTNSDEFKSLLTFAKKGLKLKEMEPVNNMIEAVDGIKLDKGRIIDIIKDLVIIVDTIQVSGDNKKKEAQGLLKDMLTLMNISQRDRKFYISIFDSTVELIFFGRDFMQEDGWKKLRSFFACF